MPGPSKTHDGQDLPDYDLALETALDRLDDYQDSRSLMDKHLKSAFFDLARAKQALGPSRVGPASFNLSRIEPVLTVDITTSSDGSLGAYEYRLSQATPPPRKPEDKKGKGREFPLTTRGAVDLTYRGRASTSEKDTDGNNEKLGLRSRIRASLRGTAKTAVDGSGQGENAQRPHDRLGLETPVDATATSTPTNMKPPSRTEEGNTTNPELPPPYTDAINEYLLDPIQQFSALPPVTLRSSQQAFRLALQEGLKVIMAQQHYARLCDVIEAGNHDGCKKSI